MLLDACAVSNLVGFLKRVSAFDSRLKMTKLDHLRYLLSKPPFRPTARDLVFSVSQASIRSSPSHPVGKLFSVLLGFYRL